MMAMYGGAECRYEIGGMYDEAVRPEHLVHRRYTGTSYLSWYVRKGHLRLESNGMSLEAGPGDWVFIDPLTVRSHSIARGAHLISIRFYTRWQGLDFLPPLVEPRLYPRADDSGLLDAAERLCALERQFEGNAHNDLPSVQLRRSTFFSAWLSAWHRVREQASELRTERMDARIYRIISVLGESAGIAVDYERLVKSVGLSRAQIDRVFKASTGLTPRQYCESRCLRRAGEMIQSGEASVKEIAGALGFYDSSHFTKWFHARMGATPTAWREMEGRFRG